MTDYDYTVCLCGEKLVPAGIGVLRCPSIPPNDAGPHSEARWIPYLCAWVCRRAFRKYQLALKLNHKPPRLNPQMVAATVAERADLRPPETPRIPWTIRRRGLPDND